MLFDEMDLVRPPLVSSLGGGTYPKRGFNNASSRLSSLSSSLKKKLPDCLVDHRVPCEEEGDLNGL
jgi:hypothetical protein